MTAMLGFMQVSYAQLKFVENKGQWNSDVFFKANLVHGDLWVTRSGIWINSWDQQATEKMHDRGLNKFSVNCHALLLSFNGGEFSEVVTRGEAFSEVYHFFKGKNSTQWATGVKAWPGVTIKNLYKGVDLEIFENNGTLKYNLVCTSPGKNSNPANISWTYKGADSLSLWNNILTIHTSLGEIKENMPRVWGVNDAGETDLKAAYELKNGEVHFVLDQPGNRKYKKLIVDPILVFSTYSGSRADNFGCTGTYDELGNAFAGGTVFNVGLPVTPGAYQASFGGGVSENLGYGDGRDAAILKFSPDGKTLLWCTYLGAENNEQPHSMVADRFGNLYIMGSTRSSNFPVSNGAFGRNISGDYDYFISKLNAAGSVLLGSTYFGAGSMDAVGAPRDVFPIDDFPLLYNYADEFRGEIITDDTNVFISGMTFSFDFPKSNNSYDYGGNEDAVVFSLTGDLKSLRWSQIMGGSGFESYYGLAFGKNNDLYCSGGVSSNDLQSRIPEFRNAYRGGIADGILVRYRKSDGQTLSACHIGTDKYEQAYFAQTDNSGRPYAFGQTEGVFPIINSPFNQPAKGQFIVRYDQDLNAPDLSTTFGGNSNQPNISPSAFLVDRCERIFVSGWGGETNDVLNDVQTGMLKKHRNTGNTNNMPLSPDAAQKATDGSDFYVAVFGKNMHSLAYATYFGGITSGSREAHEHVDGGTSRFDKKGIIYQSVCAGCRRNGLFPTTPGAYSRTVNSPNCNNAIFKIDFENLNKKPTMRDTFVQGVATDIIDITMTARDPDPFDTLLLKAFRIKNGGMKGSDTAVVTFTQGISSSKIRFNWPTLCNSFSGDTVVYRIMVYDRGCPKADTTWATLKILITEPPKVIPPDAVCVSFDRASGQMKISWPGTTQSARFFKYLLLDRINPNGSRITLDTIRNTILGEFVDLGVVNPRVNDYCYLIVGVNTCDVRVETATPFCTVTELNTPITSAAVKFATVDDDKRVRFEWEMSREPDFKEFEIYRYPRGGTPGNNVYAYSVDTVFKDSNLNVDAESFCYTVIVTDKCGHISKPGGEACNVVLQGSATGRPLYYFDLNWQDYKTWNNDVLNWFVERNYSTNPWTDIGSTGLNRNFRDNKPDYDWGGYWYRVTAVENMQGVGRSPYTSQSNWIYLYQPPELWVPNAFTRNEDNLNDVWGTVPVFVKNYHMRVYDRWGQKVWESSDKKKQWDGKVNNEEAPDGVFAWYVIFDGWDNKTYKMKGTVTVLH